MFGLVLPCGSFAKWRNVANKNDSDRTQINENQKIKTLVQRMQIPDLVDGVKAQTTSF